MKCIDDLKNSIDFFIREKTKFSKKNYSESEENLENLFEGDALLREKELQNKYNFEVLQKMSVQNYKENLYTLDVLDKYFEIENKSDLNILDIGCKNWAYAKGEYTFFKNNSENFSMKGIEIDAFRLYSNFYSRYEAAKFYTSGLKGVEYLPKDFLKYDEKMDYMTWFLPFITEKPHLKWGLPLKYFVPKKMLWHAYFSLKKDGRIFVVNQGEEEFKIQKELLERCAIPYFEVGEVKSDFSCYNQKRFALIIVKKGVDDRLE